MNRIDRRGVLADKRRQAASVVTALDLHGVARFHLTSARVGDAADGNEATRTIARRTEAAAARRMETGTEHRREDGVVFSGFNLDLVDQNFHAPTLQIQTEASQKPELLTAEYSASLSAGADSS